MLQKNVQSRCRIDLSLSYEMELWIVIFSGWMKIYEDVSKFAASFNLAGLHINVKMPDVNLLNWVAVKEFESTYYNKQTLLFAIYPGLN